MAKCLYGTVADRNGLSVWTGYAIVEPPEIDQLRPEIEKSITIVRFVW